VLLASGPLNFYAPEPNLEGKKIYVIGEERRAELVRYDARSDQFVPYLSGMSVQDVVFSRDRRWVAYVTYPDGNLWRSKVDGSQRLQLTSSPSLAIQPTWSPDGKMIAFGTWEAEKPGKIYLVSAEGGELEELPTGDHWASSPTWADDGKSLCFQELYIDESGGRHLSIDALDLRTRRVSTLPGSEGLMRPRRSPDGRYLTAVPIGKQKLMLFDFATRKWTDLAKMSVGVATWSANSKYIYFDTGWGKEQSVFRVGITEHKLERVVSMKDIRRATALWGGPWSGLTPDGSPLLMRNVGSQEVYALDVDFP